MTTHKVLTTYNSGLGFTNNIDHHKIITDTSKNDGGDDTGPSPKRMMLSSLAACTGTDVVLILNKMKVSFSEFNIEVEANLTDELPKIYDKVTLTYKIKVMDSEVDKVEKAINLSEEKYCGVMAMFKKFAAVETKIEHLS